MRPNARRFAILLVGFVLCALAGCVRRESHGDAAVYRFEWWVMALVAVGSLAAIAAGLALFGRNKRLSILLLVIGPVLGVIVAPGMVRDRVEVDSDHFKTDIGIWFAPTVHQIRFDELRQIRIDVKEKRTRRGTQKDYSLVCSKKSGESETVAIGDLMRSATDEILRRAGEKGVPIIGVDE